MSTETGTPPPVVLSLSVVSLLESAVAAGAELAVAVLVGAEVVLVSSSSSVSVSLSSLSSSESSASDGAVEDAEPDIESSRPIGGILVSGDHMWRRDNHPSKCANTHRQRAD